MASRWLPVTLPFACIHHFKRSTRWQCSASVFAIHTHTTFWNVGIIIDFEMVSAEFSFLDFIFFLFNFNPLNNALHTSIGCEISKTANRFLHEIIENDIISNCVWRNTKWNVSKRLCFGDWGFAWIGFVPKCLSVEMDQKKNTNTSFVVMYRKIEESYTKHAYHK